MEFNRRTIFIDRKLLTHNWTRRKTLGGRRQENTSKATDPAKSNGSCQREGCFLMADCTTTIRTCLHKGAFQDALALRYGQQNNTPTNCDCGKAAKGGFPTIRHNEIRDLTADLQPETLRYVTANTRHLRYGEADLTLMLECPCPIKQRLRNMKEKNLRTESTRNWTCTFGNVYHWKDGHNLL